uniref:histidine kinase n=1 Tax=Chromera velia CCMP2878 TaxID=1169474 RepID=A0A0G4H300_9ALVE|eukprot:Cvel_24495.t1-p1 / transcript=Cvel_24495.t1 / gene=Cvel_24495 / organism=Chromera_velia_CCMP2878 / gene_product=hypothetical protein / transcript_product=hypothetical protein / location=Cvel_scaffold2656:9583-12549(-) / protein_length=794 / sequence_SO=supercontig / SO=protein_coding / is_pseudo=false
MVPELFSFLHSGNLALAQREAVAFWGLLGFVILFHVGGFCWVVPSISIYLHAHGVSVCILKMFLMNLHLPDRHFLILSLVDTILWGGLGSYRFAGEEHSRDLLATLSLTVGMPFVLAFGLRQLPLKTLADAEKEVQQRISAERARDVFLSYIMHEMRNPLSGASLLLYEFVESLKELCKAAAREDKAGPLAKFVHSETERLRQLASFMVTQIDKMKGVCDDVLQLEKIQKGKFEHQFVPVALEHWAERAAAQGTPLFSFQGSASEEATDTGGVDAVKYQWFVEIAPDVQTLLSSHPVGVADFTRLEQVISNFLSNAKKFTQKGFVRLKFEILPLPADEEQEVQPHQTKHGISAASALKKRRKEGGESEEEGQLEGEGEKLNFHWVVLRVSVVDSGAGLSEEDRGKLFRPYAQVRAGELQNGGGTGLGLSICKSFVEAHAGGVVGVDSAGRGEGSTFFFQIFVPLLDASAVHPSPNEEPTKPSPFFDDVSSPAASQAERRESMVSLFSEYAVDKDALAAALIPGLSRETEEGEEEDQGDQSKKPVLKAETDRHRTQSSNTSEEQTVSESADALLVDDNKFCLVAGSAALRRLGLSVRTAEDGGEACHHVITQKVSFRFILMDKHMGGGKIDGPQSVSRIVSHSGRRARAQMGRKGGGHVLLVDDDRFCLMAGSAAIRRLGFSVHTAEDGEEACDLVITQRVSFRFILRDKNMARMEGPEAISRMVAHFSSSASDSQDAATRVRPFFIGYTGDATVEARDAFLQAGANRVLFKPLQPRQLSDTLKELENSIHSEAT